MTVTTFTKTFTSGILEGLTHDGKLTHPDQAHARSWIDAVNGRVHSSGSSKFTFGSFAIQTA